jgi:predicted dehydrogenase
MSEHGHPVRLGIVGVGNMGQAHARSVLEGRVPGLQLVAVADTEPARLAAFPQLSRFDDAESLIASGEIDALLIATPHFSHTTIGIAALQAGLHVLVEKPISAHKADCERLIAAYQPSRHPSQIFAAMFNQRTDPRYRKLKELIDAGTLGRLQRINWIITDWFRSEHYYRSGQWRATWAGEGGGVLLNQCPHQLDLWQWLFGLPQRVIARCQFGRFHDIEVEDAVTALLEYENGIQGVFITTTGEAPGTNRLEVVGEDAKVVIEQNDALQITRNEVSSVTFSRTSREPFAKPAATTSTVTITETAPQHVGILRNFVAAIQGREPLLAPAVEGIHSVELANAMLWSSLRDQPVVLPLDAAAFAADLEPLIRRSRFAAKAPTAVVPVADMAKSF